MRLLSLGSWTASSAAGAYCARELRCTGGLRVHMLPGLTVCGDCTSPYAKRKVPALRDASQRAQYPLIKEYSLNHTMKPYII